MTPALALSLWLVVPALAAPRPKLSALTAPERRVLADAMLAFLDDKIIVDREKRFHFTDAPREDYAGYVAPMEKALAKKKLVLPAWDPATEIPAEFLAAKASDTGRPRRPLKKTKLRVFPGTPKSACAMTDALLARWHDYVLEEMSGAGDTEESSAAPLVWCLHAHFTELRRSRAACR